MGWSLGFDNHWNRFVGYGVPAYCDQPGCNNEIDRGLSYVCGGAPFGGERGCGLHFCAEHLILHARLPQLCVKCETKLKPFKPKAEHPKWAKHILVDRSWSALRRENKDVVAILAAIVDAK